MPTYFFGIMARPSLVGQSIHALVNGMQFEETDDQE